jgi:hypothetical protein
MLKPIGEPAGFTSNQCRTREEAIGADLKQKSFTSLKKLSGQVVIAKR